MFLRNDPLKYMGIAVLIALLLLLCFSSASAAVRSVRIILAVLTCLVCVVAFTDTAYMNKLIRWQEAYRLEYRCHSKRH